MGNLSLVYSNLMRAGVLYIGLGKVEAGMNFGRKFIDAVRDFFIRKPVGEYQKLTDLASVISDGSLAIIITGAVIAVAAVVTVVIMKKKKKKKENEKEKEK